MSATSPIARYPVRSWHPPAALPRGRAETAAGSVCCEWRSARSMPARFRCPPWRDAVAVPARAPPGQRPAPSSCMARTTRPRNPPTAECRCVRAVFEKRLVTLAAAGPGAETLGGNAVDCGAMRADEVQRVLQGKCSLRRAMYSRASSRARRARTSSISSSASAAPARLMSRSRCSRSTACTRCTLAPEKRQRLMARPRGSSTPSSTSAATHSACTPQTRQSSPRLKVGCSSSTSPVSSPVVIRLRATSSNPQALPRIEGQFLFHLPIERLGLFTVGRGRDQLQHGVEITGRLAGDASSFEAQLAAAGRTGRHLEVHRAGRRRRRHRCAQRCFPRRHRQVEIEVAAFGAIKRVRTECDLQIEVAGVAAAYAGRTLAGEADVLALLDAFGYAHVERTLAGMDVALRVDFRHAQRDAAVGTLQGVVEVDDDLGRVILALGAKSRTSAAAAVRPAETTTEQRLEEIAKRGRVTTGEAAAAEFEARVPIRRRPELLTRLPVGAELIVGRALFGILEHFVGLTHFLELGFGIRLLAHVGMIFARKLAIGALDLILGRSAGHT